MCVCEREIERERNKLNEMELISHAYSSAKYEIFSNQLNEIKWMMMMMETNVQKKRQFVIFTYSSIMMMTYFIDLIDSQKRQIENEREKEFKKKFLPFTKFYDEILETVNIKITM